MFPYHMDHTLYPTMASHVGVANYPVHAINGSNIWARYPEYFTYNCDELPNLEISYKSAWCRSGTALGGGGGRLAVPSAPPSNPCATVIMMAWSVSAGVVNKGFRIDPRDFEVALVNAVQHAGYRLRFRDIRPKRVNGTLTGWGRV